MDSVSNDPLTRIQGNCVTGLLCDEVAEAESAKIPGKRLKVSPKTRRGFTVWIASLASRKLPL
jgi:hypothetical protein